MRNSWELVKKIFWKNNKTNLICFWCSNLLNRGDNRECVDYATVDHVIPRSMGGNNDLENLVVSCKKCNTTKGLEEGKIINSIKLLETLLYRKEFSELRYGLWKDNLPTE